MSHLTDAMFVALELDRIQRQAQREFADEDLAAECVAFALVEYRNAVKRGDKNPGRSAYVRARGLVWRGQQFADSRPRSRPQWERTDRIGGGEVRTVVVEIPRPKRKPKTHRIPVYVDAIAPIDARNRALLDEQRQRMIDAGDPVTI